MNYRNAKHISEGRIDCEIEHPMHGWIPYTLNPADTDMTVNNDDLLAAMTLANDIEAYIPPTQAELDIARAIDVRGLRGALLKGVDAVAGNALRWAALDVGTQAAWAVYRQELLDVPQQEGFPHTHTFPEEP
tara:strand:+ start:93 stop:488 length:396 start_codon:yes stop_codon:yes gene_type:complete